MSEKSSIVFVNQSSGYLMIDIVHAFADQFDERVLIAGLVNPRNNPLDEKVVVERIITYDRSSTPKRLWTWGIGFLQILFLVKWKYRKSHLFLVSNPPLATLIPLFCRNRYSLLIYDVYPDTLTEYKVFSANSWLVKWWKKANCKIYNRAEHVFTLSSGMQNLMSQYSSPERITIVPVWTDNDFLKPIPKAVNPFLQDQNLVDKFLVMYSGNLGKSHELGVLIDLAHELFDDGVFVMIIGGGDQFDYLSDRISSSGLDNIRLLPWQPTEMLPFTLAAADIGVVSLGKEASLLSMPSKTFNLMSVATPIMTIAEPDSALAELITKNQIGQNFRPGDLQGMKKFILNVKTDQNYAERLRTNSIQTSRRYSPKNAKKFIQNHV